MMKIISFFFLSIIIIRCSDPPTPEPPYNVSIRDNTIERIDTNNLSSIKNLEENSADSSDILIENSSAIIRFLEDGRIEEHHQIIFTAKNLPSTQYYSSKNFVISLYKGQSLDVIYNNCEKKEKSEKNPENDKCEVSVSQMEEDFYIFLYKFKLFNDEHIIINYNYIITKTCKEVLYRQESVNMPDYSGCFCNYTYIIPEGYISLGIEDYIYLSKKNDTAYYYLDYCPLDTRTEIIRFTPKKSEWKTYTSINLILSSGFPENINLTIPKYYQGGKINNSYYRIFSLETDKYKNPNIISDDINYIIRLNSKNKQKVGVELNTAFINDINSDFNLAFNDSYIIINKSEIDYIVESRVKQILGDSTFYKEYPDYYRLGKWIYKNIVYNTDYIGKNLSPREILNMRVGVCEHFTKLYNTMLNSRGIKTAYITGWAFKKNETTGNENTLGHTWTAAYINNKWIELDATWGLFEGIPSGHILKSFFEDKIYYPPVQKEGDTPFLEQISEIQMITNSSDLEDPFPEIEDESEIIIEDNEETEVFTYDKIIKSDKEIEEKNKDKDIDKNKNNDKNNYNNNNYDIDDKSNNIKISVILFISAYIILIFFDL